MNSQNGRPSGHVFPSRLGHLKQKWRDARPVTLARAAPLAAGAGVTLSVAIHPSFVLAANEGGVSDYGVHAATFAPMTVGFVLAAVLYWHGATLVRASPPPPKLLPLLMRGYATLLVFTLITSFTYTLTPALKIAHFVVGGTTMTLQVLASPWLYRPQPRSTLALVGQLSALTMAIGTLAHLWHLLFCSQIVSAVAFATLIADATAGSAAQRARAAPTK